MKIYIYRYLKNDYHGDEIFLNLKIEDWTHEGFFIKGLFGNIKKKFYKKKWFIQNMDDYKTNQKITDKNYKLLSVEEV
jgi:hypothetical protein